MIVRKSYFIKPKVNKSFIFLFRSHSSVELKKIVIQEIQVLVSKLIQTLIASKKSIRLNSYLYSYDAFKTFRIFSVNQNLTEEYRMRGNFFCIFPTILYHILDFNLNHLKIDSSKTLCLEITLKLEIIAMKPEI